MARKRNVVAKRIEEGEPIYDKAFKQILRHNRKRYIYLSIDNGHAAPMGVYLTYSEVLKLIVDLKVAQSRLGCI